MMYKIVLTPCALANFIVGYIVCRLGAHDWQVQMQTHQSNRSQFQHVPLHTLLQSMTSVDQPLLSRRLSAFHCLLASSVAQNQM